GTKNGRTHRVWLPQRVQQIIAELGDVSVIASVDKYLDRSMRAICKQLSVGEKVTPHDLRRTHGSTITALGFGRDAMNRIQNHIEGGIGDVYDRHDYSAEIRRVMEAVASRILALAEGKADDKVVPMRR